MSVKSGLHASFGSGRIIGLLWVVCIIGGIYGLLVAHGTRLGQDALLISGAAMIAVSALLYEVFRPTNPAISLVAAFFGFMAVIAMYASGDTSFFGGIQCLLLSYLVLNSSLLPRTIGVLIAIAGLAQLIFLSTLLPASFIKPLVQIGYIADGIGETTFALWLLVMGVRMAQWEKLAARTPGGTASPTT